MEKQILDPDIICRDAIQAKLNIYQAKEHFGSVLKTYNDQLDVLVNLVAAMKGRILELERNAGKEGNGGSMQEAAGHMAD